jgi:pyruvate/2-oxoglutarate dehydrogenase complex dihydrolipoamide dehydrogenase (E3) component
VTRVQAIGERPGFMKVLVGESDDRILGFTMIGPEAGEVMAAVQTAMLGSCHIRNCATPFWRTSRWRRGSAICCRTCRHVWSE